MRDRLIKLINEKLDCNKAGIIPEWLADDLIDSKQIIVLPCKLGTEIYHLDLEIPEDEPQCSDCKDNYSGFGEFWCDHNFLGWPSFEDLLNDPKDVCPKFKPFIREEIFTLSFWAGREKWFNRSWFLTEEEAKKALEEYKQSN